MSIDLPLKYGCNPNQTHARLRYDGDGEPLVAKNGKPSFINLLDGLRGWQLVRDLKAAVDKPAASSFKHVSPAGAAVAGELSEDFRRAHFYPTAEELELSPIATAYARARASDRVASFGDFIAVSEVVDESLARLIKPEVSDGIIAPGYDDAALELLSQKKGGGYVVLQVDASYAPPAVESRTQFGITLEESHNDQPIDGRLLENVVTSKQEIPAAAREALLVASAALKHTQSNSVALGWQGAAIGIGAGQQSRIACTRLACDKAERYFLKQHPKALALSFRKGVGRAEKVNLADQFVRWAELDSLEIAALRASLDNDPEPISAEERASWLARFDDVAVSSDAFFPFRDNLDRAARSGVRYVVQAGGSKRDDDVIAAADEHGMAMAMSGVRLFLH